MRTGQAFDCQILFQQQKLRVFLKDSFTHCNAQLIFVAYIINYYQVSNKKIAHILVTNVTELRCH